MTCICYAIGFGYSQISAAVGQHTASVQEGLVLVTPKAGSVTVVGVVVGSEQRGTAEPEVVAGDAVDDASVTAAGVGPEKGAAGAGALGAGPAKPAAVAAVAVAAAATVPSSAVAAVVSVVADFDDAT